MGLKEVQAAISSAGLPSVHMAWEKGMAPDLPWCVFYLEDTDGVFADNKFATQSSRWVIELYQKQSDPSIEEALEQSIVSSFTPFSKSEAWVSDENCIQTTYYFKEL